MILTLAIIITTIAVFGPIIGFGILLFGNYDDAEIILKKWCVGIIVMILTSICYIPAILLWIVFFIELAKV